MKFEKKLFCHSAYLTFTCEQDLAVRDCISIVSNQNVEQMIFLAKASTGTDFEVRIYKARPSDNYVPNKFDVPLKAYESNNEFATFFFEEFITARQFVIDLKTLHPEYRVRPTVQKR